MDIKFIGWCKQDNHDKVWGIGDCGDGEYMTFWGRQGNKLQTNRKYMGLNEASKLINQKCRKGYVRFEKDELDAIHENFKKQVFIVQLKG